MIRYMSGFHRNTKLSKSRMSTTLSNLERRWRHSWSARRTMTIDLLHRFLTHTGSTTAFLEEILGDRICVRVIAQRERHTDMGRRLERESVLYGMNSGPLLAAHCSLNLSILTEDEIYILKCGNVPIGRMLSQQNPHAFRKTKIVVETVRAGRLPELLETEESKFFLKHYQLWQHHRSIGEFTEAVSECSIRRALPHPSRSSGNGFL